MASRSRRTTWSRRSSTVALTNAPPPTGLPVIELLRSGSDFIVAYLPQHPARKPLTFLSRNSSWGIDNSKTRGSVERWHDARKGTFNAVHPICDRHGAGPDSPRLGQPPNHGQSEF